MGALPSGSYLAIAHPTLEVTGREDGGGDRVLEPARHAARHLTGPRRNSRRLLEGLEMVSPAS